MRAARQLGISIDASLPQLIYPALIHKKAAKAQFGVDNPLTKPIFTPSHPNRQQHLDCLKTDHALWRGLPRTGNRPRCTIQVRRHGVSRRHRGVEFSTSICHRRCGWRTLSPASLQEDRDRARRRSKRARHTWPQAGASRSLIAPCAPAIGRGSRGRRGPNELGILMVDPGVPGLRVIAQGPSSRKPSADNDRSQSVLAQYCSRS